MFGIGPQEVVVILLVPALLLSKNVNPKIVQEMVGHATITQVMNTYSHVMPGMGDVAATALEEALG